MLLEGLPESVRPILRRTLAKAHRPQAVAEVIIATLDKIAAGQLVLIPAAVTVGGWRLSPHDQKLASDFISELEEALAADSGDGDAA
jgi:hypothetical protein